MRLSRGFEDTQLRPLVYLDMDSVICDFDKAFKQIDMPDSKEKFHAAVMEHKIFETLDWMPNGEWLVGLLDMLDCDVEILSSTGSHDQIVAQQGAIQKGKWLLDHNVTYGQNFVNSWAYKQHFARPWAIMIDDREDVIDTFRENGGLGVLYKDSDYRDMDYKIRQAVVRAKQLIELIPRLETH